MVFHTHVLNRKKRLRTTLDAFYLLKQWVASVKGLVGEKQLLRSLRPRRLRNLKQIKHYYYYYYYYYFIIH